MRFCEGAPVFAVEIRSENDYGPVAEREMATKRADYFACGTLVVWDIDLQSEDVVKS
jgi:Uma2 family endonuclease